MGMSGVFLEDSLTEAEKHAQRLCGSKHNVALITVRPLSLQKHLQAVTFKLREVQGEGAGTGAPRHRVVHGYLNSYGPEPVQHLGGINVIQRRSTAAPTQVLLGGDPQRVCHARRHGSRRRSWTLRLRSRHSCDNCGVTSSLRTLFV